MSDVETRLSNLESEVHATRMTQAARTLDQLSVFYYVLAGVSAFFALFPIFHVVIGFMMMFAPHRSNEPSPAIIGGMFVGIGMTIILMGFAYAAFLVVAGRNLKRRTRPTLVTVAAALSCMNMPLGTALGIYTLIELNKPEVRNLFKETM